MNGYYHAMVRMPDGRFLVAYEDATDSNAYVSILEIAGNGTVTALPQVLVGSPIHNDFDAIDLLALDVSTYVVLGGGSGALAGWVLTVDGSTITVGARQAIVQAGPGVETGTWCWTTSEIYAPFSALLDATHIVVVGVDMGTYVESAWTGSGRAMAAIITVAGEVLTIGTWRLVGSIPPDERRHDSSVTALGEGRFLLLHGFANAYDSPAYSGTTLEGVVITASGFDDFTVGTPAPVLSSPYFTWSNQLAAVAVDGTNVVVLIEGAVITGPSAWDWRISAVAATVSGTTITVGNFVDLDEGAGGYYWTLAELAHPRWMAVGMVGDVELTDDTWGVRGVVLDFGETLAIEHRELVGGADGDYFAMLPTTDGRMLVVFQDYVRDDFDGRSVAIVIGVRYWPTRVGAALAGSASAVG